MICRGTDESLKLLKAKSDNVLEAILCDAFNFGWDEASKTLTDSMTQAIEAINNKEIPLEHIPKGMNPFIDVVKLYIESREDVPNSEGE